MRLIQICFLICVCVFVLGTATPDDCTDELCPLPPQSENSAQQRSALSYIHEAKHKLDAISASHGIVYIMVLYEGELKLIQAKTAGRTVEVLENISGISGCIIENMNSNGINTNYIVRCGHERLSVVAIRWRGVTYVPFSDFLVRAEVIVSGEEYIDAVIEAALDDLQAKEVPSLAYPGEIVGSVQSARQKQIAKAILLNEHITADVFKYIDAALFAQKVFALFGANLQHTFRNSVSSMGASGISQFMPGTYADMVRVYYQAGLIPHFTEGARNHINSVKAMFCLFDHKLSLLPQKVRDAFREDPRSAEDYIAISYNGGEGRASQVIEALKERWDKDFPVLVGEASRVLPEETEWFLLKQRNILHYLDTK